MADLAVSAGVPETAVVLEERSTRTCENAAECRNILSERSWSRGLLITDDYHMPRALYAFRAYGMEVEASTVRTPVNMGTLFARFVREPVARARYRQLLSW